MKRKQQNVSEENLPHLSRRRIQNEEKGNEDNRDEENENMNDFEWEYEEEYCVAILPPTGNGNESFSLSGKEISVLVCKFFSSSHILGREYFKITKFCTEKLFSNRELGLQIHFLNLKEKSIVVNMFLLMVLS
jgi:hypothetical protein